MESLATVPQQIEMPRLQFRELQTPSPFPPMLIILWRFSPMDRLSRGATTPMDNLVTALQLLGQFLLVYKV
ncbi:MAG: hypothetical protein A2Y36_09505 [Treponema sp. GWA1_62_8]|nr:MAG: hypothetical protein A2Y36_09505 [Treponema sp. GWA1_62_8]OHE66775.1 MAG: hypothetical protein A2001_13305 [Treponema sp. GWC1_61_84]